MNRLEGNGIVMHFTATGIVMQLIEISSFLAIVQCLED